MVEYLYISQVTDARIVDAPMSGRTASGYGPKIPTRYMLRLIDGRERRVYMAQYGNSGAAYVVRRGVDLYLSSDVESTLEAMRHGALSWADAMASIGLPVARKRMPGESVDIRGVREPAPVVAELAAMSARDRIDFRTGNGHGDYVSVTRTADGFRARHVSTSRGYDGPDAQACARFTVDRVSL